MLIASIKHTLLSYYDSVYLCLSIHAHNNFNNKIQIIFYAIRNELFKRSVKHTSIRLKFFNLHLEVEMCSFCHSMGKILTVIKSELSSNKQHTNIQWKIVYDSHL